MRKLFLIASGLILALALERGQRVFALEGQIRLEETELVLRLGDGRVLRRDGLIGLTLILGSGQQDVEVRIDGFEEDRTVLRAPLPLYRMSVRQADGSVGDLCHADPSGRRAAFAFPDGNGGFNLTCTSGAEGKCVLFGYRPWETREGVPMRDLLQACIHLLRADYGGDDRPSTRNGTLINLYDRFRIQGPLPEWNSRRPGDRKEPSASLIRASPTPSPSNNWPSVTHAWRAIWDRKPAARTT